MRKVQIRDPDGIDSIFADCIGEVLAEDGRTALVMIEQAHEVCEWPIVVMVERAHESVKGGRRFETRYLDYYVPAGPHIDMKMDDPAHWATMLRLGVDF